MSSDNPFEFIPEKKSFDKVIPKEEPKSKLSSLKLEPINNSADTMHLNGNKFPINRSMIDESDTSLSRGIHAEFEFRGDKCVILNKSSNGSTFIQVPGEIEVQNGALIMLGDNKIFKVTFE